jgi:hypothetical protein
MGDTHALFHYLVTCSKNALESVELARLNQASNLRKELRQVLEDWIESEVDARLARRLLEYMRAQTCSANARTPETSKPVPLEHLAMSFVPPPCEPASPTENGSHPTTRDWGKLVDSIRPSLSAASPPHTRGFADEAPSKQGRESVADPIAGDRDGVHASAGPSAYRPALLAQSVAAELQALEHVARYHAPRLSCTSERVGDENRGAPLRKLAAKYSALTYSLRREPLVQSGFENQVSLRFARQRLTTPVACLRSAPRGARGAIENSRPHISRFPAEAFVPGFRTTPMSARCLQLTPAPLARAPIHRAVLCNCRVAPAS